MPQKLLLATVAILMALGAVGMSAQPADAFGPRPFIKMWVANDGVVQQALERAQRNPTRQQLMRVLREAARADTRIITWIRDHQATACQRRYTGVIIKRGVEARRSYKAAARAVRDYKFGLLDQQLTRAVRFQNGMAKVAVQMIYACP
jgi:hypothetical protein